MLTTIPTSSLKVGSVLASPVHDQRNNTKLLAAGLPVTEDLLWSLKRRGVHTVTVDDEDVARLNLYQPQGTVRVAPPHRSGFRCQMENTLSRELDDLSENRERLLVRSVDPFVDHIARPGPRGYDLETAARFSELHRQAVAFLGAFHAALASGEAARSRPGFERLEATCHDGLRQASEDLDLYVCLGANPFALDYPHRHSVHVAMLAMAIGTALGLDKQHLIDLGMGCMIHDCGMLKLGDDVYGAQRVLEPAEFRSIVRHPVLTFEVLEENLERVPAGARMVAYQIHERCDGSGYPRGRTGERIHELAKIAAVADTYVALVSPRPHRRGLVPYFAVETILRGVREGLFDARVARGLLRCVSLFPIGSYVALSDGRVGRVIRSAGEHFDRPVLESWPRNNLDHQPAVLDLAAEPELRVVRPLARLR
jgi:hypothetical protein